MRCQLTDFTEVFWEAQKSQIKGVTIIHFTYSCHNGIFLPLGLNYSKQTEKESKGKESKIFHQWNPSAGWCGKKMPVKPCPEQSLPWHAAAAHRGNIRRPGQRWSKVMAEQSPWDWPPGSALPLVGPRRYWRSSCSGAHNIKPPVGDWNVMVISLNTAKEAVTTKAHSPLRYTSW